MKRCIAIIATLPFALLTALRAAEVPQSATKPNIVFILADDMGYADAGINGCTDIKTPHLDQIARSGVILKSLYSQPVCSAARAALMTGRYPSRTGVYSSVRNHAEGLELDERTLAQTLQSAGYETAIVGKWHLGGSQPDYRPLHRGFDHQYGLYHGLIDYDTHEFGNVHDWHRDDQPSQDKGYATELLAEEACQRIRGKNPDKPLFLYLPFNAVHRPYQVPEKYSQPYEKLEKKRQIYAGMLAAMDEAVGQVLVALDDKNIRDNTFIIFASDNGGPSPDTITHNHPLRAGKFTIYEGGVRVIGCATWPGHIPSGEAINEPVHMIDWYPTLGNLVGGSLAQKLPVDGRDIWPVLNQGAKSPHEAIFLYGVETEVAAIREGDWKLLIGATDHQVTSKERKSGKTSDKIELYNVATDLGEQKDLAATMPEKANELYWKLSEAMKTAVPSITGASGGKADE